MNLKTACIIALAIMLFSILLTIGGSVLFYTMLFAGHYSVRAFMSPAISLLLSLILTGGIILLLMATLTRLNNPDSGGAQSLFSVAGVLILLATLIHLAIWATTSFSLFQHLPRAQFFHYLYMTIPTFLANLTLGLFAITLAGNASGKFLAAVTLLLHVFVLAFVLIQTAGSLSSNFNNFGIIQNIGYSAMTLGSWGILAAIILFLLMFLMHRPWPPMARVEDSSPDPLPTLSAHAPLPEG
jgi:hypothetical protein